MKKKRNFREFLATSSNEEIKKLATEYAIENDFVTLDSLAEKYNLSTSTVKKIIEYAIVNCIVSFEISLFIKGKAHRNQVKHCKVEPKETSSDIYYSKIFKKRYNFIKTFNDEKVLEIVNFYLNNPCVSGYIISSTFGFSLVELNLLLKKAIIFNIVDEETVSKLKVIALKKAPISSKASIEKIFDEYIRCRKFYVFLTQKISTIFVQIQAFDSFSSLDEESLCQKVALQKELEDSQNSLQKFIDSF